MMRKETERWDTEWSGRDVVDDIAMRDFFNGRQFILKFFPWWGKAVEAGCGLGRYVFYLSALGREIVGVDFSGESIRRAKHFAETNGLPSNLFDQADIDQLDFKENTFSYYISLGVLEHFFQGPERALAEAFRVLAGSCARTGDSGRGDPRAGCRRTHRARSRRGRGGRNRAP